MVGCSLIVLLRLAATFNFQFFILKIFPIFSICRFIGVVNYTAPR